MLSAEGRSGEWVRGEMIGQEMDASWSLWVDIQTTILTYGCRDASFKDLVAFKTFFKMRRDPNRP